MRWLLHKSTAKAPEFAPGGVIALSEVVRILTTPLCSAGLADGYFEETLVIPYTPKAQTHFPQLRKGLGIEYDQMLFFDDEAPNIHSVSPPVVQLRE